MELSDIDRIEFLAERQRRRRVVFTVVPALAALIMLLALVLIDRESYFWYRIFPREIFVTFTLALFGASAASLVMTYLQTGFKNDRSADVTNIIYQTESRQLREEQSEEKAVVAKELERLGSDLQAARDDLAALKSTGISPDETQRARLMEEIQNRLKDEAATALIRDIEKRVTASAEVSSRDREAMHQFEQSRLRLGKEIESLGRRGNLNLSLGIITTVAGLLLLAVFVFSTEVASKDPVEFSIHFIPRLTLVVFIEIFAYFFLRLYKSSLAEIKYFQNEITNLESQAIALRAAFSVADTKVASEVISALGRTERNHVLEKGQTTVDIERARIEKDGINEFVKNFSAVFAKNKP